VNFSQYWFQVDIGACG